VRYRRVLHGGLVRPGTEGTQAIDTQLRFQIPPAALPLEVERARLVARIDAPGRRVTVSGRADGGPVELARVESPIDPILLDVTEARLLRLDADGGLHLNVAISGQLGVGKGAKAAPRSDEKWTIRSLDLEVTGRVAPAE
jgi:hypothetical protein